MSGSKSRKQIGKGVLSANSASHPGKDATDKESVAPETPCILFGELSAVPPCTDFPRRQHYSKKRHNRLFVNRLLLFEKFDFVAVGIIDESHFTT